MSSRAEIIEGLQIFERYDPGGSVGAEHDVLYGARSSIILSLEEREKLRELGWFVDDQADSWAAFV